MFDDAIVKHNVAPGQLTLHADRGGPLGQDRHGGPGEPLTPEESVTALKRLIETLGSAESGKFFDGREHAW